MSSVVEDVKAFAIHDRRQISSIRTSKEQVLSSPKRRVQRVAHQSDTTSATCPGVALLVVAEPFGHCRVRESRLGPCTRLIVA
jgi:hypothetical protein